MKDNNIRQNFVSSESLCESMKERVEKILLKGIEKKGRATLALSGGNTPKQFFEYLSESDLPWEKVYITLVDERWVDADSSDSNEYLVRNFLMKDRAKNANFIGLKNEAENAKEGVEKCKKNLLDLKDDFDLVILGMGEDGHTASFFPKAKELDKALKSGEACVAITPPEAKYERISLSLTRLLKTKNLFLHLQGRKKFEVVNEAFKEGSVEEMPVRAFIHRESKPYLEIFYAQ